MRGEFALDTLHYYTSDSPSLSAARERAIRLGWQGVYLRWLGSTFPSPFTSSVSFYSNPDGAHKDLREIYEPGEPRNPRQWRDVESPVMLGDETYPQRGMFVFHAANGAEIYVISRLDVPKPWAGYYVSRIAIAVPGV